GRYTMTRVEQGTNGCFPFPGMVNMGETQVTRSGSTITITSGLNATGQACTYSGTYAQAGHMGSIIGTYNCGGGTGPFTMTEVAVSPYGFLARIEEAANGCNLVGNVGGARLAVP